MKSKGKNPKILVTGADGHLGNYVVRELLRRSYKVRGMILEGRSIELMKELEIDWVIGDVCSIKSWEKAIEGCEYVIHIAAVTTVWPFRSLLQRKVNIEGTQNGIAVGRKVGIKRFIHIGTANSIGYGTMETPANEDEPYRSAKFGLDYMDSKREAQDLVLDAYRNEGFPAIVVNPTFMIGAYDHQYGSNALIISLYKREIPSISPGAKNYLYTGDAAVAIVNALSMGRVGECYLLGHENLTYKEAFRRIGDTLGVGSPRMKIPAFLVILYGWINTFFCRLIGKQPKVTPPLARIACIETCYDSSKAINELGLPQTPIEKGVGESIQWYKERNLI